MQFSIIIPVAPGRKAPVLDSIAQLDYPKDQYEWIIEKGTNPSLNRNRGITKSKGAILAFVDDDAYVKPDWLTQAEAFFKKYPNADIVGGPQLTPPSDKTFARLSGYVYSSFFGAYKMASRYRRGKVNLDADELNLTSANLFVKKEVFERIAAFDTRLFPNEETEFLHRGKKNGLIIAYHPDIIVYHKRRDNLMAFLGQSVGYGKGRARQDRLTCSLPKLGVLIPISFIIYLLFLPLLFILTPFSILPFLIYLGISIIAAIYISIQNRDILAVVSYPFLCFLNHCAYPLGYIYEVIRTSFSMDLKKEISR